MADCPRPVQVCGPQTVAEGTSAECPDWEVCLPFGGRLYQQDGCVRHVPGTPPEDGVYGLVTVQNGCIVSMEPEPVAKYQSDPCAPVPCPCDSSEDGGGNLCNPSTKSGNQYECDASGRPYAHAYVQAGDNVTVSGNGTSTNPYIVSSSLGDAGITNVRSNTSAITVSVSNNVATVSHATGYNAQTINGMVFDAYGHLVDYSSSSASTTVNGIIGTNGISAETNNAGIVTIGLESPAHTLAGQYLLGGYTVEIDANNRVYNISQEISAVAGSYTFGAYAVTVNDYGSITDIAALSGAASAFHAFLASESTTSQHTLTFTMPYSSRAVVDVYANVPGTTSSTGQTTVTPFDPTFYIDGERHHNTLDLSNGASKHIRLFVTGALGIGTHELNIRCSTFPTNTDTSVQITLVTAFDSTTSTEDEE